MCGRWGASRGSVPGTVYTPAGPPAQGLRGKVYQERDSLDDRGRGAQTSRRREIWPGRGHPGEPLPHHNGGGGGCDCAELRWSSRRPLAPRLWPSAGARRRTLGRRGLATFRNGPTANRPIRAGGTPYAPGEATSGRGARLTIPAQRGRPPARGRGGGLANPRVTSREVYDSPCLGVRAFPKRDTERRGGRPIGT